MSTAYQIGAGQPGSRTKSARMLGLMGIGVALLSVVIGLGVSIGALASLADDPVGGYESYGAAMLVAGIVRFVGALACIALGFIGASKAGGREIWSGIAIGAGAVMLIQQLVGLVQGLIYNFAH